jgi:hypothetical protein
MASSTTIPRTTMSAAMETWCRAIPNAFIAPRVPHRVTGMAMAAMRATRKGRSTIVTIITEMMASRNSWLRCEIRSLTTPGWSATRSS